MNQQIQLFSLNCEYKNTKLKAQSEITLVNSYLQMKVSNIQCTFDCCNNGLDINTKQ